MSLNINSNINKFKIALCQLKVVDNKFSNLKNVEKFINNSIQKGNPDIIVLPEFFNCPMGLSYVIKYSEEEHNSESLNLISSLAKKNQKYIVAGSIPIKDTNPIKKSYYNSSFIFDRKGEIIARHNKIHLFDIDIPGKMTFKESSLLSAGNNYTYFETEFCKIGIGICYDIRFPEYCQILKKEKNIDLMIYPAAFSTTTGPMHWELLARSRALDNNIHLAICSPARNTENPNIYQCYGFSSIYDPFAKCLATTSYEEDIVFAEIDLQLNRDIESQIPTLKQKRNDLYELKLNLSEKAKF
jgi:omega-amidase